MVHVEIDCRLDEFQEFLAFERVVLHDEFKIGSIENFRWVITYGIKLGLVLLSSMLGGSKLFCS
jgi:hypothetical protein